MWLTLRDQPRRLAHAMLGSSLESQLTSILQGRRRRVARTEASDGRVFQIPMERPYWMLCDAGWGGIDFSHNAWILTPQTRRHTDRPTIWPRWLTQTETYSLELCGFWYSIIDMPVRIV
jgi:hypothetical protein